MASLHHPSQFTWLKACERPFGSETEDSKLGSFGERSSLVATDSHVQLWSS